MEVPIGVSVYQGAIVLPLLMCVELKVCEWDMTNYFMSSSYARIVFLLHLHTSPSLQVPKRAAWKTGLQDTQTRVHQVGN